MTPANSPYIYLQMTNSLSQHQIFAFTELKRQLALPKTSGDISQARAQCFSLDCFGNCYYLFSANLVQRCRRCYRIRSSQITLSCAPPQWMEKRGESQANFAINAQTIKSIPIIDRIIDVGFNIVASIVSHQVLLHRRSVSIFCSGSVGLPLNPHELIRPFILHKATVGINQMPEDPARRTTPITRKRWNHFLRIFVSLNFCYYLSRMFYGVTLTCFKICCARASSLFLPSDNT